MPRFTHQCQGAAAKTTPPRARGHGGALDARSCYLFARRRCVLRFGLMFVRVTVSALLSLYEATTIGSDAVAMVVRKVSHAAAHAAWSCMTPPVCSVSLTKGRKIRPRCERPRSA